MQKICKQCTSNFEVTDSDLAFYDKISPVFNSVKYSLPPPTLCPDCRRQRRLAWRNERNLYHRKCNATGEDIITVYHPKSDIQVYHHKFWWGDSWNIKEYARDIDFSRSFFDQLNDLRRVVPRPSLMVMGNENSDYVNHCGYSKNCYLSFNTDYSENCFYSSNCLRSKDSYDLFNCEACELCYDSQDLKDCYQVIRSSNCQNCSELYFCDDMIGCRDCFGCKNLRNKQYYFFNEKLSSDEYKKKIQTIMDGSFKKYSDISRQCAEHLLTLPYRFLHIVQCENVSGDYLENCRNTLYCFDSFNDQDVAYSTVLSDCKDTYDFDIGGYNCELCYEMVSAGDRDYHCLFCMNIWGNAIDCFYCDIGIRIKNCFGCIGLRDSEYCILNKQYTKEEYELLVPKIIELMKQYDEWGGFQGMGHSLYSYNETLSQSYFPLTETEATNLGLEWRQKNVREFQAQIFTPPDNIFEMPDSVVKEVFSCGFCSKNFKVLSQELTFYKKHSLPLPKDCPDCRHNQRIRRRNPVKLSERSCSKCGVEMKTSYAPERPEIVYCEKCYLSEIY